MFHRVLQTSCQNSNGPTHEQMDDGYSSAKSEPNPDSIRHRWQHVLSSRLWGREPTPVTNAKQNSSDQAIGAQIAIFQLENSF